MGLEQTAADIRAILTGPHKYVNGQYVSSAPTQEEIDAAENAKKNAANVAVIKPKEAK